MLQIVLIIVALSVVVGLRFFYLLVKGVDVSKYEHLQTPQITTLPDITVLEVPFETSTDGLKEVFGFLFKTYFKIKGVPKMPGKIPPSLARYENTLDFEMEDNEREAAFSNVTWKGFAALPVLVRTSEVPKIQHDELNSKTAVWHYGETAEILHVGPYEKETLAVRKLMAFIEKKGYEVNGLHEEVYLRSPGTPLYKPENYYTIIRYPVRKK